MKKRNIMVSKKYYTLVFGAIMGMIMSLLTSLAVTIINIGIHSEFIFTWINVFFTTVIIGFPIPIVVTPFVKKMTDRITEGKETA